MTCTVPGAKNREADPVAAPPEAAPQRLGLDHYYAALDHLYLEAHAHGEISEFVEAATYLIGWIIAKFDRADVTADVFGRISRAIAEADARMRAQEELAALKESGKGVN